MGTSLDERGVALGVAVAVVGVDRIILEVVQTVCNCFEERKCPRWMSLLF